MVLAGRKEEEEPEKISRSQVSCNSRKRRGMCRWTTRPFVDAEPLSDCCEDAVAVE